MEFSLLGGSTINILIGFAILALTLIALFTDSTPVKWLASLLAIVGLGVLYKRIFPSDSEIKQKFEENEAAANQYYEDRKNSLGKIDQNRKRVEQLKSEKAKIDQQDEEAKNQLRVIDSEIKQLEKNNDVLEKSIDARQKKLNAFFSRKDAQRATENRTAGAVNNISGYRLKGDVE